MNLRRYKKIYLVVAIPTGLLTHCHYHYYFAPAISKTSTVAIHNVVITCTS